MSPSVKTGFSAIGEQDIETAFRTADDTAFDFVEIQMDHWDVPWMEDNVDYVRSLASEAGVDIVAHLPFGGENEALGASDPTTRDEAVARYESCIEAARSLGANKGVLHVETTDSSPHLAADGRDDELVTTVRQLDEFACERDFVVCIENLPDRYPDLNELELLAEETDVQFTIDTGHATVNQYADEDVAQFVSKHGERVSHFHLNDTRVPRDEHLPFGAGTVDFERIFGALPAEWRGTMTTEVDTTDYEYIEFGGEKLHGTLERSVD